ncbi:hypothetical protein HDA32_004717 [Spinactinospora alkalitolerans]|uniref:Uncharacterized protein n=1 Tax=Spinactinospora alkalitolerans TaxID=687207 RepID=A0A852U1X9_9ACTN|nr:hypothetical protein [Spinactinospora alkalitolerans]NYE49597.1 hypothetical protein [Spinactinospora alkalitolerans]
MIIPSSVGRPSAVMATTWLPRDAAEPEHWHTVPALTVRGVHPFLTEERDLQINITEGAPEVIRELSFDGANWRLSPPPGWGAEYGDHIVSRALPGELDPAVRYRVRHVVGPEGCYLGLEAA